MPNKALTNLEYLVGQDSSSSFDSPIMDSVMPNKAVGYQFKWDAGVKGVFTWYASIFKYEWEQYVACESVELEITGSETSRSAIVALPDNWLVTGYLKFSWVPDGAGSTGSIDAAIRIVPV